MIIFDTETTGLPKAGIVLSKQPKIIEFAAIKIDQKFKITEGIEFLIDPEQPLEPFITKLTGITDAKLKGKPKFVEVYTKIADFFLGEASILAHNAPFDIKMLSLDLLRIDKLLNFPWPITHHCSIENTRHLTGKKLKMTELYKIAIGKELEQKHRAMDDVEALLEITKWMVSEKLLKM